MDDFTRLCVFIVTWVAVFLLLVFLLKIKERSQLVGPAIDRAKTTEDYQIWRIKKIQSNLVLGRIEREENLFALYVIEEKSSPFMGDEDLQEAQKLLVEMGITKFINRKEW